MDKESENGKPAGADSAGGQSAEGQSAGRESAYADSAGGQSAEGQSTGGESAYADSAGGQSAERQSAGKGSAYVQSEGRSTRISVSVFAALAAEMLGLEFLRRIEALSPLVQYGAAVVLGIGCFLLLFYGLQQGLGLRADFLEKRFLSFGIAGGAAALNAFCVCLASSQLSERFPGNADGVLETYPLYLIVPVCAAALLACVCIYRGNYSGDRAYAVLMLILGLFVAIVNYSPNIFKYDPFHAPAYTTSIYNVLAGHPYDSVTQTIYGRYGIFYYLPLKLLTLFLDRTTALYLLICAVTVLSWFCMARALRIAVRSRGMQLLGLTALTWQFTWKLSVYWALRPHRLLFPAMLIWYCVKKKEPGRQWAGWVLCAFAILWNLETGLACVVAYAGFHLIRTLRTESFFSLQFLRQLFAQVLCAAGAFLCSYAVFNFYNLLAGGSWQGILCYIYPLGPSSYHVSKLNVPLPLVYNSYGLQIMLFTAAFCFALSRVKLFSRDKAGVRQADNGLLVLLALLGFGVIMYYINRASVGNLWISYTPALFLLIILCDRALGRIDRKPMRQWKLDDLTVASGAATAFAAVSVCALLSVASIGRDWAARETFSDEMETLHRYTDMLECILPEDTYAFGNGVQELYGMLGWDVQCHTIDNSGVVPEGAAYMRKELKEKDVKAVFCPERVKDLLGDLPYTACLKFVLNGEHRYGTYVYMVREDCLDSPECTEAEYAYAAWRLCEAMRSQPVDKAGADAVKALLQEGDADVLAGQLDWIGNSDDSEYIDDVYRCVFDRSPSKKEKKYCAKCLSNGISRAQLMLAVTDSRISGEFCDAGLEKAP